MNVDEVWLRAIGLPVRVRVVISQLIHAVPRLCRRERPHGKVADLSLRLVGRHTPAERPGAARKSSYFLQWISYQTPNLLARAARIIGTQRPSWPAGRAAAAAARGHRRWAASRTDGSRRMCSSTFAAALSPLPRCTARAPRTLRCLVLEWRRCQRTSSRRRRRPQDRRNRVLPRASACSARVARARARPPSRRGRGRSIRRRAGGTAPWRLGVTGAVRLSQALLHLLRRRSHSRASRGDAPHVLETLVLVHSVVDFFGSAATSANANSTRCSMLTRLQASKKGYLHLRGARARGTREAREGALQVRNRLHARAAGDHQLSYSLSPPPFIR